MRRSWRRGTGHWSQVGLLLALAAQQLLLATPPARAAAPGVPELIAPAAGHVFGTTDAQLFTVRAGDPEGDVWLAVIEVIERDTGRVTAFTTAPAGSGDFSGALAAPPLTPGTYTWRARATDASGSSSAWSERRDLAVGPNHPPDQPTLLAPAEGAMLRRQGNEPFSIAVFDRDDDIVSGIVIISRASDQVEVARVHTTPSPSGGTASGLLAQPLPEGAYTWLAVASDAYGARSSPSSPRTFSVAPPSTSGGGVVTGVWAFAPPGLAPGSCEALAAEVRLTSATVVFNSAIVGYVGPADIRGTASSVCESVPYGTGDIDLAVSGTGASESTLTCADLNGTYVRAGNAVSLRLQGGCKVNNYPISRVTMAGVLQVVLEPPPVDAPGRTMQMAVSGSLVVSPQ